MSLLKATKPWLTSHKFNGIMLRVSLTSKMLKKAVVCIHNHLPIKTKEPPRNKESSMAHANI